MKILYRISDRVIAAYDSPTMSIETELKNILTSSNFSRAGNTEQDFAIVECNPAQLGYRCVVQEDGTVAYEKTASRVKLDRKAELKAKGAINWTPEELNEVLENLI